MLSQIRFLTISLILSLILLNSGIQGAIIYVNGTCGNDGWSGSNPNCIGLNGPKETIQAAIDLADEGDIVNVAKGIYHENIIFNGTNITLTSTDPDDPNIVAETVINGGGLGQVVTFAGNENPGCILSGFTITGGYTSEHGAGIQGSGTTATISMCVIRDNIADGAGGGINQCHGTISRCIITENQANWGGGLAGCYGTLVNCVVNNNTAIYCFLYHLP